MEYELFHRPCFLSEDKALPSRPSSKASWSNVRSNILSGDLKNKINVWEQVTNSVAGYTPATVVM